MKQASTLLLLLTGCATSSTEPSDTERRTACAETFDDGGYPYSIADTKLWQIGSLPLWSSLDQLRSTLGEPDSTFEEVPWTDALRILVYPNRSERPVWITTLNDTLAYPAQFELGNDALTTDRGRLEAGASLAEVQEAFPDSYRCRDWPLGAGMFDGLYDTEVLVDDTTRAARIALWFRDGGLVAVGVNQFAGDSDYRTSPN